jgi:hypothetical protein
MSPAMGRGQQGTDQDESAINDPLCHDTTTNTDFDVFHTTI